MKITVPMINFNPEGDDPESMDFFKGVWTLSGQGSYTFPYDLDYVYVHAWADNTNQYGTYTGSGTAIYLVWNGYVGITKISNVKAGDSFKAPVLTVSGSAKTIMSFAGKKSNVV